ncbi:heme ABC transporter ATP-binding protein [uncultured Salinisphaera sp.]|uniref:heme ABC transporter ATP-binding protein n=1 Tax=uncultured Salinisphaera sp. TaxID=359372 RepID=UPI0032B19024|tara:strand:- start:3433 stop:4194 length:762 start_codon:yes stop_codon:yes gene_type:complete
MSLSLRDISVPGRLHDVTLDVAAGERLGLIGPNGAGKSTLIRAIIGDIAATGHVVFDGQRLAAWPRARRARSVACLAQQQTLAFPLSAREVIALARAPHATGRTVDDQIVAAAAHAMDISHLLTRAYTRLSGGERQRVQLARVLAQIWRAEDAGARLLLLDEPVAALDIAHQSRVMTTLAGLAEQGVTVVFVLHDVSLAAAHADRLVALRDGRLATAGPPDEVVTEANLAHVFAAATRVIAHPDTGHPVVLHG